MDKFINYYECPDCENMWSDKSETINDDDCAACGFRHVEPYETRDNDNFPCGGCGTITDIDDLEPVFDLDGDGEMIGDGSNEPLYCRSCRTAKTMKRPQLNANRYFS